MIIYSTKLAYQRYKKLVNKHDLPGDIRGELLKIVEV